MPHSAGGGSHGGGFHGGSHGGGGGGSSSRVRRSSFKGATRYVYYKNRKPVIVYSNYDITKPGSLAVSILLGIYFLILAGVCFFIPGFAVYKSITIPKKLTIFTEPDILIEDNVGVIKDKDGLYDSLERFYDETGIMPAVLTVSRSDWKLYNSLEHYAYYAYLDRFDDESHWLIVYSVKIKDDGFVDWYWEGMQGNDTDNIITVKKAEAFTKNLQKYLLQSDDYTVDGAIAKAFDELTPVVMNTEYDSAMIIANLLAFTPIALMFLVMALKNLDHRKDKYYRQAMVCKMDVVEQKKCEYCGGIYIKGMHTTCPHCAAEIPQEFQPQVIADSQQ